MGNLDRKRRISGESGHDNGKRARRSVSPAVEEDMDAILAQIKEMEESEALAKQLEAEWNGSGPSTLVTSGNSSRKSSQHTGEYFDVDSNEAKRHNDIGAAHASVPEVDAPPDEQLEQYRDLFTRSKPCTKCGSPIKPPRGYVIFNNRIPPPSMLALLHLQCSLCHTNHCRGCFAVLKCPKNCKGRHHNADCRADCCCAEVRAIALFETLSGFDRQSIGERNSADDRARASASNKEKTVNGSVGPGGTGYGTDAYALPYHGLSSRGGWGSGRGRGGRGAATASYTARDDSAAVTTLWEEILVKALTTITTYLPNPYSDDAQAFDLLPHASVPALLALSQLPDLLGALLRNDSVTDWSARSELYHAMLVLLRRLADCELTVPFLAGRLWERTHQSKGCALEDWMWRDGEIFWERTGQRADGAVERTTPLYDCFQKLTRQCQAFLTGATTMMAEGEGDGNDMDDMLVKSVSLCGDIIAAGDDIERAMTAMGQFNRSDGHQTASEALGKGKGRDPAANMENAYSRACGRLAFQYIVLHKSGGKNGLAYPTFHYHKDVQGTASSSRNPKDRLHLLKELATMATSLPPGVWVRIDEIRNDVIKIMIAGPEGTPYAGGLFEFDCWLPLGYPHQPPQMHLRTTAGGRVRFNPNLYSNGKVCLSLLGTWPGRPEEQWSSKSTLLQVLVSIQSMILVDAPYFNEPGFGAANLKNPQSITYNKNISRQTVRWAMLEWMSDEHRNDMWGDVIASHFSIRGPKIRETVQTWASEDRGFRAYDETQSAADDMVPVRRAKAKAKGKAQSLDLLAALDEGLAKVEGWTSIVVDD